jgi:hypothetical protein
MELVGANAFLARSDQVDRLQPQVKRNLAVLKDGADTYGKRLAAFVALVHAKASALALKLADALHRATARTGSAARPHARLNERESGCFVVKVWGGQIRGHDVSPCWQAV